MEMEDKSSLMVRVPYDLMVEPLAATKLAEAATFLSSGEAGKTDRSAPVSTKKGRFETVSNTDSDPTLESIEEI